MFSNKPMNSNNSSNNNPKILFDYTQPPTHIQTLAGHSNSVCALAIFPDGRIVSGAGDTTLKLWDSKTGQCLNTLRAKVRVVSFTFNLYSRSSPLHLHLFLLMGLVASLHTKLSF